VVQWDLCTGKQKARFAKIPPAKKDKRKGKQRATQEEIEGHSDELWTLSVSTDGKYLATGGKDRRVGVWDIDKGVWLKGFRGHKDSISVCLVYPFI
jgi:ribosomal RNA-processing protein 9